MTSFDTLSDISNTSVDKRLFRADDSLPLPTNKVGIEIEIEDIPSYTEVGQITKSGYWTKEQDYSLRGKSVELVSIPLFGKDISAALEVVKTTLQKSKVSFSIRTSVHVHLECIDMSPKQLVNFVLLYSVFEKVLFSFIASHREDNIYCLPFYRSEGIKNLLVSMIRSLNKYSKSEVKSTIRAWPKYSAMNICNIPSIGTIEFRALEGTIDKDRIITWIKMLMAIKKYSLEFIESTDDLPKIVSGYSPVEYVLEVFGEDLIEYFNLDNLEQNILEGVRYAQDIIIMERLETHTKKLLSRYSLGTSKVATKYEDLYKKNLKNLIHLIRYDSVLNTAQPVE